MKCCGALTPFALTNGIATREASTLRAWDERRACLPGNIPSSPANRPRAVTAASKTQVPPGRGPNTVKAPQRTRCHPGQTRFGCDHGSPTPASFKAPATDAVPPTKSHAIERLNDLKPRA